MFKSTEQQNIETLEHTMRNIKMAQDALERHGVHWQSGVDYAEVDPGVAKLVSLEAQIMRYVPYTLSPILL